MSESLENIALAGLRSRRPDLDEAGLRPEFIRICYGRAPRENAGFILTGLANTRVTVH